MLYLVIPFVLYNLDHIINFYNSLNVSDFSIYQSISVLNLVTYWSTGLLLLLPSPVNRIQTKVNSINLYKIVKLVLFNQIIITPICIYGLYEIYELYDKTIPTVYIVIRDILISLLFTEVFFYYIHRLLHYKYFYRYIHSIHHTYSAPISITAIYAHPLEYIFGNILPIVIGPIVCNSHLITIWIWQLIVIMNTVIVHSGFAPKNPIYKYLYIPDPTKHDVHHMSYKFNYGVIDVLDYLHGTLK
jgi:sterol desaturase/sphingolipid hydroxylase (fatty acid hydroxylase superfamily)